MLCEKLILHRFTVILDQCYVVTQHAISLQEYKASTNLQIYTSVLYQYINAI